MLTYLIAFKGGDLLFTIIRSLTILTFLAWPLLAFVTIMAFGGPSQGNYGVKIFTALALAYPWIFMLILNISEKHLVPVAYPLGVVTALLPLALAVALIILFNKHGQQLPNLPQTKSQSDSAPFSVEGKPYAMDFSGAESIFVRIEFRHKKEMPPANFIIEDPQVIEKINSLLSEIPKDGDLMKKMAPGEVLTAAAVKNGEVFAYIMFYDGRLKTESTGFNSLEDDTKEKQLFEQLFSMGKSL